MMMMVDCETDFDHEMVVDGKMERLKRWIENQEKKQPKKW